MKTIADPRDIFSKAHTVKHYGSQTGLFEIEKRLLRDIFPPPGTRILDLGCGAGRTTAHLAQMGYKVVGVDIVPEMIKAAKARLPGVDFHVMDAGNLDFPDSSFDCVWFSFNGIDHLYPVANRFGAMRKIFQILKPGGLFVYSSNNLVARLLTFRRLIPFIKYQLPFIFQHLKKHGFSIYWENQDHRQVFEVYCAPPWFQRRNLRELGFTDIRVHSWYGDHLTKITLVDRWPHYSARKPR